MKNIFYIILFTFISNSIYSQSGWVRQSPLPNWEFLRVAKFIDKNTGFVCGGDIYKTTNAGLNWIVTYSNPFALLSMYFINNNIGYTCGGMGTILKTTNTGNNWIVLNTGFPNNTPWYIYFSDENTGYVAGDSLVLKTINGGISWYIIYQNSNNYIYSGCFINSNTGFIGGLQNYCGAFVDKTTDGGNTWNLTTFCNYSQKISTMSFIDSINGYLAGDAFISGNNYIYKTTNCGVNWQPIPIATFDVGSISFINNDIGYYVEDWSGYILKTTNGGYNWNTQFQSYGSSWIHSISMVDSLEGYIAGEGILKTTNGGVNWNYLSDGTLHPLFAVCFINNLTGFAVSGQTLIVKTTNGGTNWISQSSNNPGDAYQSIIFVNDNTGYAAGISIIKTTDCGNNWFVSYYETGNAFLSVYFINENTGFSTSGGEIIKTTNEGNSWNLIFSADSTTYLGPVYFINTNTGFVIGNRGLILKTTNSGNNWNNIQSGTSVTLYSMYFTTLNTGYIVGASSPVNGGVILKTTNSGNNWNLNTLDTISINSIFFTNENTGFIAGGDDEAYCFLEKTTNGGINWVFQDPIDANALYSIWFVNDSTGYAVGYDGKIIKTTTGGNPISVKPISNLIPSKFNLFQNYPNPFNPITKIKFDIRPPLTPLLSKEGTQGVALKIYDILGREVTTLVNEKLKPGSYEVEWDGSRFASGVYFYQLRTNDFTQTKKLVLIK